MDERDVSGRVSRGVDDSQPTSDVEQLSVDEFFSDRGSRQAGHPSPAQPPDTYRNDHSKMVVQLAQPCAVRYRRRTTQPS